MNQTIIYINQIQINLPLNKYFYNKKNYNNNSNKIKMNSKII